MCKCFGQALTSSALLCFAQAAGSRWQVQTVLYSSAYHACGNGAGLLSARGRRCLRIRVGRKRSLALRDFALGIEALERFVAGEPLYRVHECVFGVPAARSGQQRDNRR